MDNFDKFFIYSNPLWWVVLLIMLLYYICEQAYKHIKNWMFVFLKINNLNEKETDVILKVYHTRTTNGVYDSYNWFNKWAWDRGIDGCIKSKLKK